MGKSKELAELGSVVTQDGGNVGVNTGTPLAPLHVKASGAGWDNHVILEGATGNSWNILNDYGASDDLRIRYRPTGTEALRIGSAGAVTTPQQPSFRAGMAGTNFTGDGAGTVIPFTAITDTVRGHHNRGNNFNASTGRFTAPISGSYYFDATILGKGLGAENRVEIFLCINGVIAIADERKSYLSGSTGWSDGYLSMSISSVFYLSAGDVVDVRWETNDSTPALHATNSSAQFSGFLIG